MDDFDLLMLRAISGKDVPGLDDAAANLAACERLKAAGYVVGRYSITDAGRQRLENSAP